MKILSAIILLLALTASANAAEPLSLEFGAGSVTCANFADAYRAHPQIETIYFTWAQGFMSATNEDLLLSKHFAVDLNSIPDDIQKSEIRAYCDLHPLEYYYSAVNHLMTEFKPIQGS